MTTSFFSSTQKIPIENIVVEGDLTLPSNTQGMVVFVHGSGSSRLSPRNQYVAQKFNQASIATLLFDLLTPNEEKIDVLTAEYRFNIDLLTNRLIGATQWLQNKPQTKKLKLGYFGASTGAAAALIAATKLSDTVTAIVSRGGRPDLAGAYLSQVKAPTLLLVGGWDEEVIELNRQAQNQMTNQNGLTIIPNATHLFEEPGKLEEVAKYATEWFKRFLHY
ncbi:dienelactone hydrolase family protein [Candidatus Bathycorpusculum sp.]|uniref:dienelactone hydrolase family protein n=1 Tax=Candidatus Bathycorpusculum sp. TaxID=2994959 RepID=UPI00282FA570|nr:dienelactone hydrolase family protein [Candidatus Termitimicrobium sp.]MCL2685720.1 dienelactone hydrolase family protein [Candidatus Termitimicrobium sp.]